jgi:DNA-binding MarR family transcriptional regulator
METQSMHDPNVRPIPGPDSDEMLENNTVQQQALMAVIDETTRLFHFLSALTSHIHASENVAVLCRTLLHDLYHAGPQSVPSLARAQNVTRQSIQVRVNTLVQDGLVILQPNPAHKRSPLVTLTSAGKAMLERVEQREKEMLAHLHFSGSASELQSTAESLHAIRVWLVQEEQRLQMFSEAEDGPAPSAKSQGHSME